MTMEPVFSLKNATVRFPGSGQADRPALNDLCLDILPGQAVALVGSNGSGKSTLLRLLSGVYEPTSGGVRRRGRIDCLFDLTAGMEDDASGYENLEIRGAFLNLPRARVEACREDMVDFADLGPAIHKPLRTYSAGMRLRLAFSLLLAIENEVLLIDEVIGVGDLDFFQKSLKVMSGIVAKSGTVVIASHALSTMQNLCNRALWLDKGEVKMDGPASTVIPAYADK